MDISRFSPSVERCILLLVGLVQFVNIVDFMMVMPLGPDFAPQLGISASELGWIGGSYTASAAVTGIIAALFIDKFDRKTALLVTLLGLTITTAAGGMAWNLSSLLVARVGAGVFGGPATSLAWAIVADVVEPARRGRAMGKVMGAFSIASIVGVPFGLEMAQLYGWRTPFLVTALMGMVVMVMVWRFMPSLRLHLEAKLERVSFAHLYDLLKKPLNLLTFVYILMAMMASFMMVPNLSAYVQYNLHYPREGLGWLYAAGGTVSYFTMRATGQMIDRFNASVTSLCSNITYIAVLLLAFIVVWPMSVTVFFMVFMFALGMRNVSSTTLATKIPTPQDRAGFMSLFSCFQGVGMAGGAFLSTILLHENADKSLEGMGELALIASSLSLWVPLLIWRVERSLTKPQ